MRDCPFLPMGSGGFHLCHSTCMAYHEHQKQSGTGIIMVPGCKRLDGGGALPQPVDIGIDGTTRFAIYCMSLTDSAAWERLARILEAKIEATVKQVLDARDLDKETIPHE